MNKYYTPDIEEFCVGFECEILTSYDWIKGTFPSVLFQDTLTGFEAQKDLFKATKNASIKVKYLDGSDIEELGFKYKAKTIDLWFEKEGIYLREDGHHLNNIKLQYGLHDNKLKITFCYVSGEEQIHFEGKIKNKSELVKLLKMLEIN